MFILVAGEDEVAFRITEALMERHHVVFVGPESTAGPRLDRLDVEVVHGPVSAPEVLRTARVQDCDLFIACSSYDELNMVACLAAQRLGAKRAICFLTRPGFFTIEGGDAAVADSLGIDAVIRPSEQLADEILRIVTVPGALDVQQFQGGQVRLLKYEVEEGAPITKAPLRDLKLPKGVLLIMARRGEDIFIPKGDTHFRGGDRITAIGSWPPLRRLLFKYLRGRPRGEARKAAVVGGGTVGFSVVRGLEEAGWSVKVIESDRARCEEIASRLRSLVLHGDGSDLDLLEQERIADSSVLVAVTSNDEKNLLVSLLAKHLGVPRIITRADRLVNERLFEKVGIDVVLSSRGAAIRSVVRDIVEADREMVAELEHGDIRVLDLELPPDFPATSLMELRPPTFAIVGAIIRGRKAVIPKGPHVLRPGDHILVFCKREDEEASRRFFLHRSEERRKRSEAR